jgi:hypothetical protein
MALGRLVAGMTKKEVEAVVGRYHRPNLYQGRRYYAWIAEGAMLSAFFDGLGETLSGAILDVPYEQRVLDLSGGLARRIKNCTVHQVWNCIGCRRRYRRSAVPPFVCPICLEACEHVPPGIAVPGPQRVKLWDEFWTKYKAESSLLFTYAAGELRQNVNLEIFGVKLPRTLPGGRRRR